MALPIKPQLFSFFILNLHSGTHQKIPYFADIVFTSSLSRQQELPINTKQRWTSHIKVGTLQAWKSEVDSTDESTEHLSLTQNPTII